MILEPGRDDYVLRYEPLVSIVTPSRNQARFLPDALGSIKAQTHPAIEHIVVDGASIDGTVDILEAAATAGSPRWISEPDRGMYDALNKGLRMATGDILGYLNCDDVLTPWAIATVVGAFEANPTADVVFGDGLTIDESTGAQRLALIPPFDARASALGGSLVQPAVFWRRRALERAGAFDADLRFVGDLDYWLRLGSDAAFVRVDEVLAIERHHDAALSRAAAEPMAREAAEVRERHQLALGVRSPVRSFGARARAALWRRWLWLRFLRSVRGARSIEGRPWGRFIADGKVRVAPSRVIAMFVPRLGGRFAWDAVVSERSWFAEGSESAGS